MDTILNDSTTWGPEADRMNANNSYTLAGFAQDLKMYNSAWNPVDIIKPSTAAPGSVAVNDVFRPTSNGTYVNFGGVSITDYKSQIIVYGSTGYSVEPINAIPQTLANARWVQILVTSGVGYINFDWGNDKIIVQNIYLNALPDNRNLNLSGQNIEITGIAGNRYLLVNIDTGTLELVALTAPKLCTSNDYYLVAAFKPETEEIVQCNADCIQVEGEYVGRSAVYNLIQQIALKANISDVPTLDQIILKTQTRTNNLYNKDDVYLDGFIGDSEVFGSSATFGGTKAIQVEAGKTYSRYALESLNSWDATSVRLFDDTGLLQKEFDDTITVPPGAINPRIYITFYLDGYNGIGAYVDLSTAMFMETSLFDGVYYPYYIYNIDDSDKALEVFIEELRPLVQSNGTDSSAVMSQTAITNSIANALSGLSSTTLESTTGQSTTSGMTQKAISDAIAEAEAALGGSPQYRFAAYPTGGYENFTVQVDVSIADTTTVTTAVQDAPDLQAERCILQLPTNYTRGGEPTKLIIGGYGSGNEIISSTTQVSGLAIPSSYLLAEGFAVLCCNGTPGDEGGVVNHGGVPQAYRSYLEAYKYITGKYNIDRDGVILIGYSMGTLITNQIEAFGQIPVLCTITYGFDLELWKQQYSLKNATIRQYMCEKFGFEGTAPTFTSNNPPTSAEQSYILANIKKWIGYNPLTMGLSGEAAINLYSIWLASSILVGGTGESTEAALYENLNLTRKSPIKIFISQDETTNSRRFVNYYVSMLRNAGCQSEVRILPGSSHGYGSIGDSINVDTLLGGTVSVSAENYEAMLFIKRWVK